MRAKSQGIAFDQIIFGLQGQVKRLGHAMLTWSYEGLIVLDSLAGVL